MHIMPWIMCAVHVHVRVAEFDFGLICIICGHLPSAAGTRYVSGAVVRTLRVYPGQYVVHVVAGDGTSQVSKRKSLRLWPIYYRFESSVLTHICYVKEEVESSWCSWPVAIAPGNCTRQ